jgi:NAD-dependent dihydropyrimidine dehydrogenase PreA subunit
MPAIVDTEKCNACKSCEEVCPTDCINVPDAFAVVKTDECIDCNACMDACMSQAITMGD